MTRFIDPDKVIKNAERKRRADLAVRLGLFSSALICSSVILFTFVFIFIKGLAPFTIDYVINGESYRVDLGSFLVGDAWRKGEAGYGAGYIIVNTLYVTLLTALLSAPISVFTALVIVKMSPKPIGAILNSAVELLAGIPSVIFGLFGMGEVTLWVKNLASAQGVQTAGGLSVLTVVLVLTMMSFPMITMLSVSALKAVSHNMELGSLALGASVPQTNFKVVLTSAKSGIFAGVILGIDRALGEATAVSLVCGNAGTGPSFSLFSTTRTLTSTMLTGMSDASGLNYDIRFSVGILLIVIIILTNFLLNLAKRKLGKIK